MELLIQEEQNQQQCKHRCDSKNARCCFLAFKLSAIVDIISFRQLETDGIPLIDRIFIGSRDRLLPIIMTAMSSALALIPIVARGAEPGNEIQSPMALVILGGLLSSTLLNIFVVPILYYVNNKKKTSSHQV